MRDIWLSSSVISVGYIIAGDGAPFGTLCALFVASLFLATAPWHAREQNWDTDSAEGRSDRGGIRSYRRRLLDFGPGTAPPLPVFVAMSQTPCSVFFVIVFFSSSYRQPDKPPSLLPAEGAVGGRGCDKSRRLRHAGSLHAALPGRMRRV